MLQEYGDVTSWYAKWHPTDAGLAEAGGPAYGSIFSEGPIWESVRQLSPAAMTVFVLMVSRNLSLLHGFSL
jgi:hypothetical protein